MSSKRKRGSRGKSSTNDVSQPSAKKLKSAPESSFSQSKVSDSTFAVKPFPDKLNNVSKDERVREAELYELLVNEDEATRVKAAACIVGSLLNGAGSSAAAVQRHLENRLFRGLASGRKAARLGFSLAITGILEKLFSPSLVGEEYSHLTFETILEFLQQSTAPQQGSSKQEERDYFFGQLFGIECFINAGNLFTKDAERWSRLLDLTLALAQKKSWIRSHCGWLIVQAVHAMDRKQVKATLKRIADDPLCQTSEGLAIWLVATDRFDDLSVKPWKSPLERDNLKKVAAVLKEQALKDPEEKQESLPGSRQQANWTSQLHFVWDFIASYYVKNSNRKTWATEFENFWQTAVEGQQQSPIVAS